MTRVLWIALLVGFVRVPQLGAQAPVRGPLEVFNAGSLAVPFHRLLEAFAARHPEVLPAQEHSGSLAAVRKLTELGKIPDVLAVADVTLIPELLIPQYTAWYATFATNSLTLVYTDASSGAQEIDPQNWFHVLLRPEVRWGHADPALDPAGYRTFIAFQLAERHYHEPGLADRLSTAAHPRYMRGKSADLIALLQLGELDYAWAYASLARLHGLRFVPLPPEVSLDDPSLATWYESASVRLPGVSLAGVDSVEIRGRPIVYALTIPRDAPHPETARAFVRFVASAEGRSILEEANLTTLDRPVLGGPGAPPPSLRSIFADAPDR